MIREAKRGKKGPLEAVRYFKFQHHPRGVVSFPYLFKIEWQVIQKILDFSRSRKFLDDRQLPAIQNFLDLIFHINNSPPNPLPYNKGGGATYLLSEIILSKIFLLSSLLIPKAHFQAPS